MYIYCKSKMSNFFLNRRLVNILYIYFLIYDDEKNMYH